MNSTSDLISLIKLWAAVPNDQPAFQDSELLQLMNAELFNNICPLIIGNAEEYFVDYIDYTITSIKNKYIIPSKAIGTTLREVKLINSVDVNNETFIDLPCVSQPVIQNYTEGYYLQGNYLILINPVNHTGYKLRMYFFYRPNQLIMPTDTTYGTRAITAINTGTNTITVSGIPAGWTNTTKVDLIQSNPPFDILDNDLAITIVSNTMQFSSLPENLQVGDYVAYTGYSCFPNIPYEAHGLLCQAVVLKMLETLGDAKGVQVGMQKYITMRESIIDLLTPRNSGERKVITSFDGFI